MLRKTFLLLHPFWCASAILFFEVGATTPLFIAGLSIGIPGAITGAGAEIANHVIDKKQGKKAAALVKADEEITKELWDFKAILLSCAVLLHNINKVYFQQITICRSIFLWILN